MSPPRLPRWHRFSDCATAVDETLDQGAFAKCKWQKEIHFFRALYFNETFIIVNYSSRSEVSW